MVGFYYLHSWRLGRSFWLVSSTWRILDLRFNFKERSGSQPRLDLESGTTLLVIIEASLTQRVQVSGIGSPVKVWRHTKGPGTSSVGSGTS